MKFLKSRILIMTCIVCLLPILLGISVWNKLPDSMAIHFDINNNPDNYASKGFVVFGLPVLMMLFQLICCFFNDLNSDKYGERGELELVSKWIIPSLSVILQASTIWYALSKNIDVRKIVCLLLGIIFLLIGNCLLKYDYIKNRKNEIVSTESAKKINRFIGYETIALGILNIISVFLPPIASIICILLIIPYAVSSIIYGIIIANKKPGN